MCAPRPCSRDKDACDSVMVEKPNRVCHFGSSVSHQGAAHAKTLTFPCASAHRADPELLSNLREEMQTYTEGRGKKGENPSFGRGPDPLQPPAVVAKVPFIKYFYVTSVTIISWEIRHKQTKIYLSTFTHSNERFFFH